MKAKYFSHDVNARTDPKIVRLRRKYGMEGYGIYFALLEMMACEQDQALSASDEQYEAVAYDLHTDMDMAAFVAYCVEVGLFDTDGQTYWSPSFRRRLAEVAEKAAERSERAKNAVNARWSKRCVNDQPKPENERKAALNASEAASCVNDPEYERFALAYERKIGSIPQDWANKYHEWFERLGADVMIAAVDKSYMSTNPVKVFLMIINSWIDEGVDTIEKVREYTKRYKKEKEQQSTCQQPVSEKIHWVD